MDKSIITKLDVECRYAESYESKSYHRLTV
jgi:hypothetical protein